MRVSTRAICIGILAIVAVSCGADVSTQTSDSLQSPKEASITDFTATLVGEGSVNLQSELQKSPVALWFWAPG